MSETKFGSRDEWRISTGGKGRERCHVLSAIHYVGLQLELNRSSFFAIPATGGLSCNQIVYYTTRTLKTFFEDMSRDTDPYFKLAVYVSMGMKYKF